MREGYETRGDKLGNPFVKKREPRNNFIGSL